MRVTKENIYIKIVYYGPGLSGKTTNLEVIHKYLPEEKRGDLTSIATETDRTIFFDCLPFEAKSPDGRIIKLQLFTIPGQVYYRSTRQLILRGADGVVFVADSQRGKEQENRESFEDLCEILEAYRVDLERIPLVFQYNKRDLWHIVPAQELDELLNQLGRPSFCASALQRIGIVETMQCAFRQVMSAIKVGAREQEELQALQRRREELYRNALEHGLDEAEWAEFLGFSMDPRHRGPVSLLLQELKALLQKELQRKHQDHIVDLCEAILQVDPGEHKIARALEGIKRHLKPHVDDSTSDSSWTEDSQKTYPPAVERLREKLQRAPEDAILRAKLVHLYLKHGFQDEAVEELLTLAKWHLRSGQIDLAQSSLHHVLRLVPDHPEAHRLLQGMDGFLRKNT